MEVHVFLLQLALVLVAARVFGEFAVRWGMPPVIGELADEYVGKVKVGKVNVDNARQTAAQYGIQNIPTVMLFDKGKVVDSFIGVQPKAAYEQSLDKVV